MIRKIKLLFLFSFFSAFAFGQFVTCNSNTSISLSDIYFINSQIGIAVGDSGIILRSTDGGINWSTIMTDDTVSFRKVRFFNAQKGIALGSSVFITSDAGLTWQNTSIGYNSGTDIAMIDDSTCYITTTNVSLMKSVDAGVSFFPVYQDTLGQMELISFVNDTLGYSCAWSGGIATKTLKTIDGGMSWDELTDTSQSPNPTVMEDIEFISEDVGFKAGWYNPHIQKTTDGAKTWNYPNMSDTSVSYQIYDLFISKNIPNAYYACGWYGHIYKSIDGGNSWFGLNSFLITTTSLHGIFFLDDNTGWVVGAYGTILKTTSGGIGLNETNLSSKIKIYPNPASDFISIETNDEFEINSCQIHSVQGKVVLNTDGEKTKLNIQSLAPGVYILNIETDKGFINSKFVKE